MENQNQDDYENFFGEEKKIQQQQQPFIPNSSQKDPLLSQEHLSMEQLEEKERELKEREDALIKAEQVKVVTQEKKANFPICFPLIIHDIQDEIKGRWPKFVVYQGLFTWIALSIALVLNVIAAWITVLCPVGTAGNGIESIYYRIKFVFITHLVLLFGCPLHFILCYHPLYAALRSLHIARFIIFFIGYTVCILLSLFAITGYYDVGFSGLLLMILYAPPYGNTIAFITNLIMTLIWIALVLSFISIFVQVIMIFRRENLTIKNLTDFVKDSVTSGTKTVVNTAVTSAVTSALNTNK